jgi:hypothetical protein
MKKLCNWQLKLVLKSQSHGQWGDNLLGQTTHSRPFLSITNEPLPSRLLTIIILQARFDIDSVNVYKGLSIVPSKMLSLTRDGIDWIEEFKTVATFYYDDLPNPLALDAELSLWDTYWTTFE